MIRLFEKGAYLVNGNQLIPNGPNAIEALKKNVDPAVIPTDARRGTISDPILQKHNLSGDQKALRLKFDQITSHDITYVGIVQTARASGLERFPLPYILTNCHNSLCAVGGTINEDDHVFGLSAAQKYGGVYVPPHLAVIHQYMREMHAGCGQMILGSDSHTRYGALGTLGIGEGGGELVKQLLCQTYDIPYPKVVGVYLKGKPQPGVGPQDIALAIIAKVFQSGFVKNAILEFVGEGVHALSMDERMGIDVMTTETACLSSIWETDRKTEEYLAIHGRPDSYRQLAPEAVAYYDGMISVDLDAVNPMIALPFHPSNVFEIETLNDNLEDILSEAEQNIRRALSSQHASIDLLSKIENHQLRVDQGIIAGCAGGSYENITAAADILRGHSIGNGRFSLSVYPASEPIALQLIQDGSVAALMEAGAVMKTSFCGPCFGAGDTPFNQALSIRHTTRNFPNREGSKPSEGQLAAVALVDTRSIAASALCGGYLTPATELECRFSTPHYFFNQTPYRNRVYNGIENPEPALPLQYGPNIKDWPKFPSLGKHLLIQIASFITDAVTTTDELIPSGETSSFRSNPVRLSEFTLSRKDPEYVARAKRIQSLNAQSSENKELYSKIRRLSPDINADDIQIGSGIYAVKPGDGSAREQAASCQKVLGGIANFVKEYATKRYRSNLINWGIIPFLVEGDPAFNLGANLFIPDIMDHIRSAAEDACITAYVMDPEPAAVQLKLGYLTEKEKEILLSGCLINYNQKPRI